MEFKRSCVYTGIEEEQFLKDTILDKRCYTADTLVDLRSLVERGGPKRTIVNIRPDLEYPFCVTTADGDETGEGYVFCYYDPDEGPNGTMATVKQLSEWLGKGNGQFLAPHGVVSTYYVYQRDSENDILHSGELIRRWGDYDWHLPTLEYMK